MSDIPLDVYSVFSPLETVKKPYKENIMSALTLQEIIWEVTNKCNKNCEYCGSKAFVNNGQTIADPIKVAEKIAKYPPKEITLSGGEPGTLSEGFVKVISEILRGAGIQVKCVTNGLVIDNKNHKYFDWIGLSINDEKDLLNFEEKKYYEIENLTIITNFGTHNIWLFDKLKAIMYRPQGGIITWQVQLTQGKLQLPAEGIKYLRSRIMGADNSSKIVKADNLQDCRNCFAGIHSCGITYDGYVIPCLSMRSWADNVDPQGNILENDLETIWKEQFKNYRFGRMPCCRDSLEYPDEKKTGFEELGNPYEWGDRKQPKNPMDNIVLLYGVQADYDKKVLPNTNGGVYTYAVVTGDEYSKKWPTYDINDAICVYACFSANISDSSTNNNLIYLDKKSGQRIDNIKNDK